MPREIKEEVIKVFNEQNIDGNNKNILRVVRWNKGRPQLEKRKFYRTEDDQWKPARASGMNIDDFKLIKENSEEIEKLLTGEA